MRQGQQKRMRGRNRNGGGGKGPNPLSRAYESNGPDVKVRGTAAHIAEKYVQLARDAQSSGDPILAEAYLQHAEHYFRVIAAAQPQFNGQPALGYSVDEDDDGEDGDFDGPIPSMPQSSVPPSQQVSDEQPRFNHQRERNYNDRNFGDRPSYNNDRQPYGERQNFGERGEGDRERFRNDRFQNDRGLRPERFQDRAPQERQGVPDRPQERAAFEGQRPQERAFENQPNGFRGEGGEGERPPFQPRGNRRERFRDRQLQDRSNPERHGGDRNSERQPYHERVIPQPQPVVPIDQPQPDIADDRALSSLPSFITGAPMGTTPAPAPVPAAPITEAAPAEGEGEARLPLRARRRRAAPKKATEAADVAADAGEAPAE